METLHSQDQNHMPFDMMEKYLCFIFPKYHMPAISMGSGKQVVT